MARREAAFGARKFPAERGVAMSAWIRMISDEEADAQLSEVLDLARTPHGTVDNVMRVHSLRPNTMRGHVILYRACLHDEANTIPTWFQEVISSYVSLLNDDTTGFDTGSYDFQLIVAESDVQAASTYYFYVELG